MGLRGLFWGDLYLYIQNKLGKFLCLVDKEGISSLPVV